MHNIFIILVFCIVLFSAEAKAQVYGCTDPLASNYNVTATVNDGSCIYNNTSVAPVTSKLLSPQISETSGLIFWNNYLWTHNDNTDTNLYVLDTTTGAIVQTYPVYGFENTDWEDISQDDHYIYIGDFGNNANGNRTDLRIIRIEKNSLLQNITVADTINFSYSNQTNFIPAGSCNTDFDCEAFIVTSDSIFLFTKQWISNQTSIYALPKTPGTYIAQLQATNNVDGLITGATCLQPEKLVVLCGYSTTLQPFALLLYDFNGNDFFSGNKRKISISLPLHQIEGITTNNGLFYYFSNEYFSRMKIIATEQKLHLIDLSPYLGDYLNYPATYGSKTEFSDDVAIYPNPGKDVISVKINTSKTEKNYFISDISGKIVLSGILESDSSNIHVNKLKKGTYFLQVGHKDVFKWIKE
ncbi:MAG TPA: T9SS type A sorting domain-containing protein [Bacteroidales bacterium]|nr:T9SS type A sorting domain-containing protein [Bacteroidales bacterium]